MKLLNQSSKYLSIFILIIIAIWSTIFYFFMLETIHDSIDEELENHKRQIIRKIEEDKNLLSQRQFDVGHFKIKQISKEKALTLTDLYQDKMMPMQDADDPFPEMEPVRILTTAFETDNEYYELKIVNSMIEEDDLVKDLFYSLVVLYVLLVSSVIFINNKILKKLWMPFYDLLGKLKKFRLDKPDAIPQVETNIQEFNDLNQVTNELLGYSKKTYQQQQEFIENASHELRTPLAVIKAKLELIMESENLSQLQADEISQILQVTERMSRLNKSLLLLTKINNKQFSNNASVHLNKMINQTIQNLAEIVDFKKQKLVFEQTQELFVKIDVDLANIIVNNLINNAISHGKEGDVIKVSINQNSFKISNHGDTALDNEKVFHRFYKSNESKTGTGLGLSIVNAICELYQYKIMYHFSEGKHVFEIKFQ